MTADSSIHMLPDGRFSEADGQPAVTNDVWLHWPVISAGGLGLAVTFGLFFEIIRQKDPSRFGVAWVILILGFALTAFVVMLLATARRRAVEVHLLAEKLAVATRELRVGEEDYRRLVENSPDAIVSLDPDGRILSGNPFCSKVTGWSPDEFLGRPFWAFVHAEDLLKAHVTVAAALRGETPAAVETRILEKSGNFVPMEFTVMPRVRDGKICGVVALGRDFSVRNKAEHTQARLETQLRRAQKMEAVGRLAGGIAHDFNNFLTVIMANSGLARMELAPGHPVAHHLEQIDKVSERAAELVRQILTFSRRQEQGRSVIHLQPVLQEALKMLRATLPAFIEIRTDVADDCPPVLADAGQIHQVLLNLATNSAHAMRNQGGLLEMTLQPLTVDAELVARNPDLHEGSYVRVTVTDNGHGMDAATLDQIFEPFFTTKVAGEGTGLGLPVVHGIIKSHGGAIMVYSEVDRGTAFNVFFPAAREGEVSPVETRTLVTPLGSGQHVLLVDDERSLAESGQRIMERLGYQVTVVDGAESALEMIRAGTVKFDCIVTDLTMSGMNGMELARACHELLPATPVVLMSGYGGSITPESLRAHGIRELMLKPFSPQTLAETLQRALASPVPLIP